jgi:hypothetical protein
MDFNEQKRVFLDLLEKYPISVDGCINISNSVLVENNLDDRTFWETTCSSLAKDGVLIRFDDPIYASSRLSDVLYSNEKYNILSLIKDALLKYCLIYYSGEDGWRDDRLIRNSSYIKANSLKEAIENVSTDMEIIKSEVQKNFQHKFEIDIALFEKLKEDKNKVKNNARQEVYTFSGGNKPSGKLRIENEIISFTGMRSVILKYFFDLDDADYNHKTYNNFSDSSIHRQHTKRDKLKAIDSDNFTKNINGINDRVRRVSNFDIFERGETKKIEPNCYRLSNKIKK